MAGSALMKSAFRTLVPQVISPLVSEYKRRDDVIKAREPVLV